MPRVDRGPECHDHPAAGDHHRHPDAPWGAAPPQAARDDVDEHVYEALRTVASGFLLEDVPADQLVHAIRVAAAGEDLLAPSVTRRLLAEGLSNAEIGSRLFVGEATAKTHVARILTKPGVRDRVQAVIVAFRAGPVPLDR